MLSTLLFGLGIAIALFFVSNIVFDRYIEKKYLSEEEREQRIEAYKNDLQKYVTDNGLSCDDTKKIAEWARSNKYLYLLIYKDDQLLFESGQYEEEDDPEMGENKENADDGTDNSVENDGDNTEQSGPEDESGNGSDDAGGAEGGNGSEENADNPADKESSDTSGNKYPSSGITVKTPSRDELIAEAVGRGSHPIVATDGVLLASMVDYTEYLYYDVFNIVSLFIAFASFILVMWVYFFEITKRITRLGKEVTAVADGDMHRTITAEGEDEITRLCSDVEYMRSSMLENIEKEHAALEANRELITAMSHDIRTPLTVLLGYIDIMKLNAPEGDMQQYIEASERTALRLKKMSDDMFGYFLVYGGGIEVEVQECEARTLIDQMLSGHVFLLREQGYTIDFNFESENADFLENVIVVTDPPQLMRIVENLLSNIMKYADKEKEVSIKISAETDEMTIRVSNYVALNPDMAQKNGIGLRSCMKLANAMDIRFSSEEADGVFTSVLNVPIMPMVEYKDADSEEEKRGIVKWLLSVSEKCKSFFKKAWAKLKDFILRKE
jgi:signal transduction histidine kinase